MTEFYYCMGYWSTGTQLAVISPEVAPANWYSRTRWRDCSMQVSRSLNLVCSITSDPVPVNNDTVNNHTMIFIITYLCSYAARRAISISMTDLYHQIYSNEIFKASECIWHENTMLDFLRSILKSQGYAAVDGSNKVWQRGSRTVVTCVVDDFSTCAVDAQQSINRIFDENTLVVTDNKILCPTKYKILRLPDSFFGIYAHSPLPRVYDPQRRFTFAVNRIDIKRLLLLLEIVRSSHLYYAEPQHLDFVNFNCWSWGGDNNTAEGLKQNFIQTWHNLEPQYQELYQEYFDSLLDQMPLRNHSLSLEESYYASGINVVIETYSSEYTIALSEKTFAAICGTAPWALYCGRHAVSFLDSIGFDVLYDLVPHRYDGLIENQSAQDGDKLVEFVCEARLCAHSIQSMDREGLQQRLSKAAQHNQQLLQQFRQQWPLDLVNWLPKFVEQIA